MSLSDRPTVQREVTIVNRLGLHARAAAQFVSTAGRYESDIQVNHGEKTVNGKSIMGMMMLAAGTGTRLLITAIGPDAAEAVAALDHLVAGRFGEPE